MRSGVANDHRPPRTVPRHLDVISLVASRQIKLRFRHADRKIARGEYQLSIFRMLIKDMLSVVSKGPQLLPKFEVARKAHRVGNGLLPSKANDG